MIDFPVKSCVRSGRMESSALGPTPFGDRWSRVAKRIPIPPGTKDAIMSLGLLGATGTLDVDGLTVDLVPVGGSGNYKPDRER